MLTESQFQLLVAIQKKPSLSQNEYMMCSIESYNETISQLESLGFVQKNILTENGFKELASYKVDNAIIMAAGLSTRLVPLSIERPKALLRVRGEILIERQIEQLKSAGINDITVVVGYLKEQLFYLEDKYGVKIIVNEDYYRYNNTSSLAVAIKELRNTYICSSDNYFVENVFEQYVYKQYYAAEFASGVTNEYCLLSAKNGLIERVSKNGENAWYMTGHAYFTQEFSKKFKAIFKEEYNNIETKESLWEDMYIRHINELDLYIRKYDRGTIYEFDLFEQVCQFDPNYINNIDSKIFHNICIFLKCSAKDVIGIIPIKEGLTNISFKFEVGGKNYVYRHPGHNTGYINRAGEACSMEIAKKLKLDKTFLFMDANNGWKISEYKVNPRSLDYENETEVKEALKLIKTLHEANVQVEYSFDIWEKALGFMEAIAKQDSIAFQDFDELFVKMKEVAVYVQSDGMPHCLCHCDTLAANFMFHDEGMDLIDWEYSGMGDPATDLATFISSCSTYTYDDAVHVLELYYGRTLTANELRHCVGYIAITSFCWFLWAIFQESRGKHVGIYLHLWYKYAKAYGIKAIELYS